MQIKIPATRFTFKGLVSLQFIRGVISLVVASDINPDDGRWTFYRAWSFAPLGFKPWPEICRHISGAHYGRYLMTFKVG